ncbi:hypothetical protein [Micromonospora sp. C95]|uniref:hypothetical protein n=1 Tax=Micromonospora sp. C95 TaxID=2824882 RepID=UPI001B38F794|nr:hypothetical protein [Micromonospora sp. C95]MBQ1026436.1 hypothetical protein [Micromonospora sp. C95]
MTDDEAHTWLASWPSRWQAESVAGWAVTGPHRLELNHSTLNLASCAVARRGGYPATGTARREGHHADGWHDTHRQARLRTDSPGTHHPV